MKTKTRPGAMSYLRLEVKAVTAEGTFEGLLSPYGNVDGGGDVIEPGAYTKTMKDRGAKVPLLWGHNKNLPIGDLQLEDRPEGLWAKGRLLLDLQSAKEAYILMKEGVVTGMSIGYEVIKKSIEGGVRHLKEIKLYEGSVVLFPMNDLARITDVKAEGEEKGDFNEELREYQILDAYYQMFNALRNAMSSCVYMTGTPEEKLAMCETVLEQFTAAFTGFFPEYLSVLADVWGIKSDEDWKTKNDERKAGASISQANADKIRTCIETLTALLGDKAGLTTLSLKAATAENETLTEPAGEDHSELKSLLDQVQAAL